MNSKAAAKIDIFFGLILFFAVAFLLAPPAESVFQVTDLPEFYCGAQLLFAGHASQIYETPKFFAAQKAMFPALNARFIPLYVAPYGLYFLTPYLLSSPQNAYFVMKLLLLTFVALALLILVRLFKLNSRWFMWIAIILPFWGPCWEAIRIEQISPMLLLSLTGSLALLAKNRPHLAAFALSFFLLKPHLAAPLWFLLLGAGRFRFCLTFLAIAIAAVSGSFWCFGLEAYKNYSSLLSYSMINLQWMAPQATPTLRGQLLRLPVLSQSAVTQFSFFIYALLLFSLCLIGFRLRRGELVRALACIAIPLGCVFSVHCFAYDLILCLPACVIAFRDAINETFYCSLKNKSKIFLDAIFLLIPSLLFCLPFYSLIHYEITLKGSIINWEFLALLGLSFYLAYRALQRCKLPDSLINSKTS